MKPQYRQTYTILNTILLLCMSCVVLGDITREKMLPPWNHSAPFVEELTLKTITVYIDGDPPCTNTVIIENINLLVKRRDGMVMSWGCCCGRNITIPLPDGAGTLTYACNLVWRKENGNYQAFADTQQWNRVLETIKSFEESPASCTYMPPLKGYIPGSIESEKNQE